MPAKTGNIARCLPGIGSINRIPGNRGVPLGVVVEVFVIDKLLSRKLLSSPQGSYLIAQPKQLPFDSLHTATSLRCHGSKMSDPAGMAKW